MRARRWLLVCASALSVPALALAVSMVAAAAQTSPAPAAGTSPAATPGTTPSASSQALGAGGLPGDPAHGATLYGQNCAACHGANMEGAVGPRLNPITHLGNTSNPLAPTYLINVITNGLSGVPCSSCQTQSMPPKGGNQGLSDKDVADIASFIIQSNRTPGGGTLDPRQLAIENVKWVSIGIIVMLILTWLLARYNMRWIDRRAAARREFLERQGRD